MTISAASKCPVDQQILIKGFLRLYLLHLLSIQECFGAEMAELILATNKGHWRPSPGSLYPLLNKLEGEELIAGKWDTERTPPRKRYSITDKGREQLRTEKEEMLPQMLSACKMLENHIRVIWGDLSDGHPAMHSVQDTTPLPKEG
ncbi:MAG: PadR family transcriptional regulator [Bacillota bacterium]